jgi:hypothetical protein
VAIGRSAAPFPAPQNFRTCGWAFHRCSTQLRQFIALPVERANRPADDLKAIVLRRGSGTDSCYAMSAVGIPKCRSTAWTISTPPRSSGWMKSSRKDDQGCCDSCLIQPFSNGFKRVTIARP